MYSCDFLCRFYSLEQDRHVPFDCCPDLARQASSKTHSSSFSLGANGVLQELRGDVQKVLGNKWNRLRTLSIQYSLKYSPTLSINSLAFAKRRRLKDIRGLSPVILDFYGGSDAIPQTKRVLPHSAAFFLLPQECSLSSEMPLTSSDYNMLQRLTSSSSSSNHSLS